MDPTQIPAPPRRPAQPPPPAGQPPPPPAPNTPPVALEGPTFEDRVIAIVSRSLDRFDGVNWVSTVGALLVAAAAIALLTQQWPAMSPLGQLGAMAAATAIVGGAALGSRRAAPGTSAALAHLAGVLVCLVAGATVVVAGGGWPAAAFACGVVGIGVSDTLRRRIASPIHALLLVIAISVAAGGAAALAGLPAAPLAAATGLALVVAAPTRRAGEALAGLAATSPLLVAANNASFTGQGTLRDMGLLGATIGWAAPVAAGIAAIALAVKFRRTDDWRYLVFAASGLAISGIASWSVYSPSTSWFGVVVAAIFLLIQAGALVAATAGDLGALAETVGRRSELVLGTLLLFVVGATAAIAVEDNTSDSAATLAAGFAAVAWTIGAYRRRSLGNLFMAALMICLGLIAALVPAWIIGGVVSIVAAVLIVVSIQQRDEDFLVSSLVGLCVGWWIVTADIAASGALMWIVPPALSLSIYCEVTQRKQWFLWGTALSLTTLAGVIDYQVHDTALPLNAIAAIGALAVIVGATRRRAIPVLLGSVMCVGAAGYQVLDASIGIEGWGWLGLTGTALLTGAAAYEFSGSRLATTADSPR